MTRNLIKLWVVVCLVVAAGYTFAVSDEEIQKIAVAMPDKPVVQPAKQRTMLVFSLCNGFKHSSVPYWAKTLDVMSEKTGAFKVVHSDDMSVFTPESLQQFDVICFNNTTKLVPDQAQQKAIMGFIRSGKGIVGIHAATDNFYDWPEGMQMMGGVFKGHPWGAGGTWAVKLDEPDHPLMKPFKGQNFKINDEIYRTEAPLYSRDNQRVLMSLDMSDAVTKNAKGVRDDDADTGISWIKPIGKGRLFYCSLGHVHAVTWNSAVLEHYLAGIQYAMGDYRVDDTPLREVVQAMDSARLDMLVGELKQYDWDKNRAGVIKLHDYIQAHRGSTDELSVIETELLKALDSDISLASKDYICRELAVLGTARSVPVLSKMLLDKETTNIARFAMETIPGDTVDGMFLDALKQTDQTDIQIGIITSLGARRSEKAVSSLVLYANNKDHAVVAAAVQALGFIGSKSSADALKKLPPSNSVQDALLCCADSLNKQGSKTDAQAIYRELFKAENDSVIRVGALVGLVEASDAAEILQKAICDEDVVVRAAAIKQITGINDAALLQTLASQMKTFSDLTNVQMFAALAENKAKVGRAEIEAILLQTDSRDVRMAAFGALSVLGNADTARLLAESAAKASDRDERDQARDALYRLSGDDVDKTIVQTIANAGNIEIAPKVLAELIRATDKRQIAQAGEVLFRTAMSEDRSVSSESVRAIQSLAGPEYMEELVDLLIARPQADTENAVVVVAEKIPDRNSRAALIIDKYSMVGDAADAQVSMLRVMGKLGDENAIELLKRAYASEQKNVSQAAFRAMTDWPANDFMKEMETLAQSDSDAKTKILAFRAYVRMLDASNELNPRQRAETLIAACSMADRVDEQRIVIGTLGHYGTVAAMNFVDTKLTNPELKAEAEVSLIQICEELIKKNPSAVKPVLEKLETSNNEMVKTKVQELLKTVVPYDMMVLDWKVSGLYKAEGKTGDVLFDVAFAPEKDVNEAKWQDAQRLLNKTNSGIFDLSRLAKGDHQVAYVKTTVSVEKTASVVLEIGSDDGVKVWVNGQQVHAKNAVRPAQIGQDKVTITLEKGRNEILAKITQVSGRWAFGMRIVDPKGGAVPGIAVDADI